MIMNELTPYISSQGIRNKPTYRWVRRLILSKLMRCFWLKGISERLQINLNRPAQITRPNTESTSVPTRARFPTDSKIPSSPLPHRLLSPTRHPQRKVERNRASDASFQGK